MPKTFKLDLGEARNSIPQKIPGRFLKVIEASSDDAKVSVSLNVTMAGDSSFNLKDQAEIIAEFDTLYISNVSQSGEWVRILISDGNESVNYPKETSLNGTLDGIRACDTMATGQVAVTTSTGLLVAVNLSRKGIMVTNTSASQTMYVGNSGVTVGTGFPIPAGATANFPFSGDIYAIGSGSLTAAYADLS